jgi:hypothetical protein
MGALGLLPLLELDQHSNSFQIVVNMNSIIGLTLKTLRKAADLQERIESLQEEPLFSHEAQNTFTPPDPFHILQQF